jgi:hypothetical protein
VELWLEPPHPAGRSAITVAPAPITHPQRFGMAACYGFTTMNGTVSSTSMLSASMALVTVN